MSVSDVVRRAVIDWREKSGDRQQALESWAAGLLAKHGPRGVRWDTPAACCTPLGICVAVVESEDDSANPHPSSAANRRLGRSAVLKT